MMREREDIMKHLLVLTVFAASVLTAGAAIAHVTISPASAPAGSYFFSTFTVPHGCDGSPTVTLRIKMPEGITSVKPQVKPG
jgi:uncharacterized protein YcnI